MTEVSTEKLMAHCGKCEYEQHLGWLPMPADSFVALARLARCPHHGKKSMMHGPKPKATPDGDWRAWLANGDTGISSETIWSVMTGLPVQRHGYPYDPADFGRCYRLLRVMPSWRARLPEVAARFPRSAWPALIEAWDELTALYEEELPARTLPRLYARMLALRAPTERMPR